MSGSANSLLVVVEPAAGSGPAGNSPTSVAEDLARGGARLAEALGVTLRRATWVAAPDLPPGAVAVAVAEAADRHHALVVLIPDTDLGRQLAPLVARRLGSAAVVGCSDVLVGDGPTPRFVKPVYGGWLEQEIEPAPGTVPVVTLDLADVPAPDAAGDALPAAEVLAVEALDPPRVLSMEVLPPDHRSVDLVHARRIVAAGWGSASASLLTAVEELADLLEGSIGATRPVVDEGRLPKERLIGQTGRTVTPELYVALGISGSPHHVAGVRGAEQVLAINRDVRAPIFQFSDVGYVADLEAVLPALVEKIKEWRDAGG